MIETSALSVDRTLLIVSTSLKAGTLTSLLSPSEASKEAVKTGNTAFLLLQLLLHLLIDFHL